MQDPGPVCLRVELRSSDELRLSPGCRHNVSACAAPCSSSLLQQYTRVDFSEKRHVFHVDVVVVVQISQKREPFSCNDLPLWLVNKAFDFKSSNQHTYSPTDLLHAGSSHRSSDMFLGIMFRETPPTITLFLLGEECFVIYPYTVLVGVLQNNPYFIWVELNEKGK